MHQCDFWNSLHPPHFQAALQNPSVMSHGGIFWASLFSTLSDKVLPSLPFLPLSHHKNKLLPCVTGLTVSEENWPGALRSQPAQLVP
jgi:hypothetical protein